MMFATEHEKEALLAALVRPGIRLGTEQEIVVTSVYAVISVAEKYYEIR
jgi:hypothetical protein